MSQSDFGINYKFEFCINKFKKNFDINNWMGFNYKRLSIDEFNYRTIELD